ncbi:ABC transporter substrate-binding protein [Mesorhizobium xinjiangense]|uniref:ABC transporter substrate-binding protein n=1 Tax=Mesorhizobium xinjiangense TaxID=2678685 RepID=UPI0012EDD077|nr:ABC transporter substrate-binding protein [Mesorhizobium xinjiangense]
MNRLPCIFGTVAAALMIGGNVIAAELVSGLAGDMRAVIPAGSTDDSTLTVQQHVYEGLVTWKENGEVAPMLAKDLPQVSEDGRSYTFKLREGVTFHDGTPLTAEAVAKSWNYLLEPERGWSCRQYFDGSGPVEIASVEASGELEVTFTLVEAAPALLTQMARADCGEGGIMAEAITSTDTPQKPIGTGPYMIESRRSNQDIVLTRFEDYSPREEPADGYAGKKEALLDKITFLIIPDPAANYSALRAGEIDVWPAIALSYAEELDGLDSISVDSVNIPSISTFAFQTSKGPLTDPALRKAVNRALDRKGMVDAIAMGYATPSASVIPVSSQFFDEAGSEALSYDPQEVAALLEAADYDGTEIVITTNKNYSVMYETGVMAQAYLEAAGIRSRLEVIDFATQLPNYYSGDYQMMTWNYAPTLDPALILDRVTGPKATTASKIWDNPQARELVDRLIAAPIGERQAIYDEIQTLYAEDAPMLVWASSQATSAYSDKVQGYEVWAGRKPRYWGVTVEE